jgi:hypothetical protein
VREGEAVSIRSVSSFWAGDTCEEEGERDVALIDPSAPRGALIMKVGRSLVHVDDISVVAPASGQIVFVVNGMGRAYCGSFTVRLLMASDVQPSLEDQGLESEPAPEPMISAVQYLELVEEMVRMGASILPENPNGAALAARKRYNDGAFLIEREDMVQRRAEAAAARRRADEAAGCENRLAEALRAATTFQEAEAGRGQATIMETFREALDPDAEGLGQARALARAKAAGLDANAAMLRSCNKAHELRAGFEYLEKTCESRTGSVRRFCRGLREAFRSDAGIGRE